MITPGWRRRNSVCPVCHMPGRVMEREVEKAKEKKIENAAAPEEGMLQFIYSRLQMSVFVDLCDNCGTCYALKAEKHGAPNE